MERTKLCCPISLEWIRRKVMFTVEDVERKFVSFRVKWLNESCDDDVDECTEFVFNLMSTGALKKNKHWRDLNDCLNSISATDKIRKADEFKQLLIICKRAVTFEEMVISSCAALQDVLFDYLEKYCRSFIAEMDDKVAKSVNDYEQFVYDRKSRILLKLDHLRGRPSEYYKQFATVVAYVADYSKILLKMDETTKEFIQIFDMFKSWISADEGYTHKLYAEIKRLDKLRIRVRETTRRHQLRIYNNYSHKIYMKSYQVVKVQEELKESLVEGCRFKKQERHLESKIEKIEMTLESHRSDLAQVLKSITERQFNCQTQFDKWCHRADELVLIIARKESEIDRVKGMLTKLKREKWVSQKYVHRLESRVSSCIQEEDAVRIQLIGEQNELKINQNELRVLDQIIGNLKRIREIRLDPLTVKLIHVYGYNPRAKFTKRDPIDEAFNVVAQEIGVQWSHLYHTLPFQPTRDPKSRNRDVEMIDCTSRRGNNALKVLALKSLQKWRRLSNDVTIHSLIIALRKTSKPDIAHKINQHIILI